MFKLSLEQMQKQAGLLAENSNNPSIIFFDDFIKSLAPLYSLDGLPDVIKIAKDEDALLAGDFEPAYTINIKDNLHLLDYKGFPMWRNQSNDKFSLHGLGLIEGNKSAPSNFTIYDTNPHCNIGGATGHGKSVLANSMLMTSSLVHPPWLAQYYLSDPKIVEMKPYATSKFKLPHVNAVAATEDPEYAISVLEYLLEIMDKRASIFNNIGVKNIDGFNKADHGLTMPMMILVLDELKAMLMTAGRLATKVDAKIQSFVAKARFAGGRCIMLSQGVVTELSPATMTNINIRIALGCTPAESEKLIGNPGASVNLGTMGKIAFNESPGKTLKENVYLTTPFLPDKANEFTNNIYDIFKHQHEVWEKLTTPGYRISPLSFFDQTAPLTKKDFVEEITGKVTMNKIFLGEPVYINKTEYKMAHTSLEPFDHYSDNLANNILFLSPYAKDRLNLLSTLLVNFDELKKSQDIDVRIYSPLKEYNDKIQSLGHNIDGYRDSSDIAESFASIVNQTYAKILAVKTDEIVFQGNDNIENPLYEKIIEDLVKELGRVSMIMKRRIRVLLSQLESTKSQQIFGISGKLTNKESSIAEYYNYALSIIYMYEDYNCISSQMTAFNTPTDIRVFFNFHLLDGTEVKTNKNMDLWMSVVKLAPVYGVHFILITDMLPNCGGALNGNFNKILFYYPTNNAIAQHKLSDDYPTSTLECVYIYTDKTKTSDKCVKVKMVEMLK